MLRWFLERTKGEGIAHRDEEWDGRSGGHPRRARGGGKCEHVGRTAHYTWCRGDDVPTYDGGVVGLERVAQRTELRTRV